VSERALYEAWGVRSWPRHLRGPAEGTLTRDECEELITLLLKTGAPQQVFVSFFSLARRNWAIPSNLAFRGELSEVMELLDGDEFTCAPEYWWPEDRSWIVCTDYDSVFTIVGGAGALIESIVANDVLEAVEAVIAQPRRNP
jgi:hypothetical protein